VRESYIIEIFGIDVAKYKLDCAVVAQDRQRLIGQKSFPNTPDGIERAAGWMLKIAKIVFSEAHAILGPTAAYHEPTAWLLTVKGLTVSIVNPAQIDAELLARYGSLA